MKGPDIEVSKASALFKKDVSFAIFLAVTMVTFNFGYWLRWRYVEGGESCHNALELSKSKMVKCAAPACRSTIECLI